MVELSTEDKLKLVVLCSFCNRHVASQHVLMVVVKKTLDFEVKLNLDKQLKL